MYSFIKEIVNYDKNLKWLTVGDGRFGSDAKKLIEFGATDVLCTDIDDSLIQFSSEKIYKKI